MYVRERARERASEQLARDSLSLGARVRVRVRGRVRVRVRECVRESETKRELYEMCDEVTEGEGGREREKRRNASYESGERVTKEKGTTSETRREAPCCRHPPWG